MSKTGFNLFILYIKSEEDGERCTEALSWFKNIFSDADGKILLFKVKPCTSGPAVTLKISENNKELSIDLVPVFTFGADKWPAPPLRQIKNLPGKIDTSLVS